MRSADSGSRRGPGSDAALMMLRAKLSDFGLARMKAGKCGRRGRVTRSCTWTLPAPSPSHTPALLGGLYNVRGGG
ncbi:hypothetical protein HaLaN_31339, partial [Haematococcus lacustris]